MKKINEDIKKIMEIITLPIYGIEYYDRNKILNLCDELLKIKYRNLIRINDDDSVKQKCDKIKEYIINNGVNIRSEYFDDFKGNEDYMYRTAYSALVKKNSICIGYSELSRILLNLYDIKSYTMVATLPYRIHPAIHYFNVVEYENEKGIIEYIPFDVEREVSRRRKNDNLEEYFEKMTISYPTVKWENNKVGKSGLGIPGNEYMENAEHKYKGMSNLPKLMEDYKNYLKLIGKENEESER